jgi:hypothetical protein
MKSDSQNLGITKNSHEKMSSKNKDLDTRLDNTKKTWYYEI